MRWKEIAEGLKKDNTTLHGGVVFPDIKGWTYDMYRWGVAAAGSPDPLHDMPKESDAANNLIAIQYSDGDREIVAHSAKRIGLKTKKIGPDKRKEKDHNVTSPVATIKKNKYGV
jgi:hypothetical protein